MLVEVSLEEYSKEVEKELEVAIPKGFPSRLYSAGRHILFRGKRVRPLISLIAYEAVSGNDFKYALNFAVGIELIHTATIIHDDIIDRSDMRRGLMSVNKVYGNEMAILAGDLLFSRAFDYVGSYSNSKLTNLVAEACIKLAEGEALESLHTKNLKISEEVYLEIIERKTASLFKASTLGAAILANADEKEAKALAKYGELLGIGFQMTDDLLDIAGENIGKPVGMDIKLGKPTFIILHAYRNADENEKKIIEKAFFGDKNLINDAIEIIKKISLEYGIKRASYFVKKAKENLKYLRDSRAKSILEKIADYIIWRKF